MRHERRISPREVQVGSLRLSNHLPIVIIGGINVLESPQLASEVADAFSTSCAKAGLDYIFKASYDKANRTSVDSARGPGMQKGLQMLADIRSRLGSPVLTDIHSPEEAQPVAEVVDMLQIPAFLCRQTDLIAAAARTKRPMHIKKAQFLAPEDMMHVVAKAESFGCRDVILCERGSTFGYHNLVVDMLGFSVMASQGHPVSFDVTHAVQLPGAGDGKASGRSASVMDLAMAGVSQGIAAIFIETHPNPDKALCDGPSALPLQELDNFIQTLAKLDGEVKSLRAQSTAGGNET